MRLWLLRGRQWHEFTSRQCSWDFGLSTGRAGRNELVLVRDHVWPAILVMEELEGLENPEVMRGGRKVMCLFLICLGT